MITGTGQEVLGVVQRLSEALPTDPFLRALPFTSGCSVLFGLGHTEFGIRIQDGSYVVVAGPALADSYDVTISLTEEIWAKFTQDSPPPECTTLHSVAANFGPTVVTGDRMKWAQHALHVDRILEIAADRRYDNSTVPLPASRQTVGRYVDVVVAGESYPIYYESAGQGPPLVCLHTAGSDSRQYRYLLEDRDLCATWQVIAPDLPGHGKSFPPRDWRMTKYELTVDFSVELILSFSAALGLAQPMLLGCSMGGSLALYMAATVGDRLAGVCSVGGSLGNPSRRADAAYHAEVNQACFMQSWIGGLVAPTSPGGLRDDILWQYAQAGPGVYHGDTNVGAHELAAAWAHVDGPAQCPVIVLSGEYDYSHRPAEAEKIAGRLGAKFVAMRGIGHFAVCEDPDRFREYLAPALRELAKSARRAVKAQP